MALFQTKNPSLAMEDVIFIATLFILRPNGIFYGHLVYFAFIWYILKSFGIFCSNLVYFFLFWYVVPIKIWQPWLKAALFGAI
jgi:hypothetical protein